MVIEKKSILLNRNINQVKKNLKEMTRNIGLFEEEDDEKIFMGKINENYFKISRNKIFTSRLPIPELHGELIENDNKTKINYNLTAPLFYIIFDIIYIIIVLYIIVTKLIPAWSNVSIFFNIFFMIVLFILPLFHCFYYFSDMKKLLEEFNLCVEGQYNENTNGT
ncbi:MAG: hypothetical protein FWC97_09565 [Treponema sp.]|nr:hypothetical protein [Treponema sp.]